MRLFVHCVIIIHGMYQTTNNIFIFHSKRETFKLQSNKGPDKVFLFLSVPSVILFACNRVYMVGIISLAKETFKGCLNQCKIRLWVT